MHVNFVILDILLQLVMTQNVSLAIIILKVVVNVDIIKEMVDGKKVMIPNLIFFVLLVLQVLS